MAALTMYMYITCQRPLLYDIINVSLQISQSYFTKCIGYNANCIGATTLKSDGLQYN